MRHMNFEEHDVCIRRRILRNMILRHMNFEKGLKAVEKLKDLLPDNFSLTDLALKWILMHDEVSVVIPGAKNKSQVQMNVHASDLEDIPSLLPIINSIYEGLIKPDVHNRW